MGEMSAGRVNYKGMDKDMRCLGFQYEVGKEYETDKAEVRGCGFHACEYPLDVFNYYPPSGSRFFEVEQSGELSRLSDDSKVTSTKIKIGAEISISGLVKAAIEYTRERAVKEEGASATGYKGAASATGNWGAASATGKASVALACGIEGKAMGALGCGICLVERGEWDGETYPIKHIKAAIVDGETIKPDVWYTLKNGEFVEL